MEEKPAFYPDFDYPASQLSAFSLCIDVFIISLKNGEIVKCKPIDIIHFKEWLNRFKIRDIDVDNGIPPLDKKPIHHRSLLRTIFNPIKRNKENEQRKNN